MAIKDGNSRLTVTMPKEAVEIIKEDAKACNLTTSNYVYLVMMACSQRMSGWKAEAAVEQLNLIWDIQACGLDEVNEPWRKDRRRLVGEKGGNYPMKERQWN